MYVRPSSAVSTGPRTVSTCAMADPSRRQTRIGGTIAGAISVPGATDPRGTKAMAEVRETGELGASVDEVWKVVGSFGGLLESMGVPVELKGEGIGQTRTIAMGPGDPTVERLEELDDAAKKIVYSIVSGALPVSNYVSTMQLSPAGEGRTKLDWSSTFEPGAGTSEADASAVISGIYKGGIGGLQARFGA